MTIFYIFLGEGGVHVSLDDSGGCQYLSRCVTVAINHLTILFSLCIKTHGTSSVAVTLKSLIFFLFWVGGCFWDYLSTKIF